MERLAKQEACQLFIEQEIEYGLERGETPYAIAKVLTGWVEKLFKAKISHKTLESRAFRQKMAMTSNEVTNPSRSSSNEKQKNKEISIVVCAVCGKRYDSTKFDKSLNGGNCPYCFRGLHEDGTPRKRAPGAGRKPKYCSARPELCLVPFTPTTEEERRAEIKIRASGTTTIESAFIEESARRIRIAFTDEKILELIVALKFILKTQPETAK